MKKINAKPLDTYSTFEIDESKLKQMYYGSLDQCRCGCGGDYHKPGEPSSADQMKINAGFALLYKSQDVIFSNFGDEMYFEVESHTLHSTLLTFWAVRALRIVQLYIDCCDMMPLNPRD